MRREDPIRARQPMEKYYVVKKCGDVHFSDKGSATWNTRLPAYLYVNVGTSTRFGITIVNIKTLPQFPQTAANDETERILPSSSTLTRWVASSVCGLSREPACTYNFSRIFYNFAISTEVSTIFILK
jgi:hypothetical protein